MTVQEMLLNSLSEAYKAATQITTNTDRSHAFCELATACAAAISTKDNSVDIKTADITKEPTKEETKKTQQGSKGRKSKKTEEPVTEEEYSDEWTPSALETLADEVEEFNGYINEFESDPEALNDMIATATEGAAHDDGDITPLNIKLVNAYIRQVKEQEAQDNG